ncbi:MAG TPA: hypothetical protein PLH75_02135 [Amaricoccus sp.]|uniref:hypothetical protein n=1 Tax=Amaricoccus sp. TaxID=1872485 RepID=UPI001D207866|nr:hypothetical protein [Amaricoccus sp.]MCB1369528.1 hypothetical protein [Paracoccaceae bacterium]MCC0065783.1 hypothetical protein [Rhodovulum sp.]MCB1375219.1 hypothetical protein [Paracoccaceae bacterium]MCB1403889.1 hypothetical protein [Paracoccaceae bacterium]HPG21569.1 hypothetical protein [Amaricoccus sp.]
MSKLAFAALAAILLFVAACGETTEKRAATGALIGGGAGLVAGAPLLGAGAGAAVGVATE